jgi:glyoxylate/hydroxypyruvate reductase A
MIVLYNCPVMMADEAPHWRDLLTRLEPAIEFRVWPDVGDPDDIEFILAWQHRPGDLQRYPNAKAIFWLGAGVDHLMKDPDLPRQVPIVRLVDEGLTSSMTEYVLQHVLRYHRRQPEFDALQRRRKWNQLPYPLARDRKVGLLGLGVLGGDAAEKLHMLGFDLAAWTRSPKTLPVVKSFHGDSGFLPFLNRTEILVCLLPLTPDTAGIINARTLAALPKGAFVINAARGGHVVDADLLAALDSGHIAQATLDVFHREPLPPDHPYWTHPKVTVTPHIAGQTFPETAAAGVVAGMRAALAGRPLKNRVDLSKGY